MNLQKSSISINQHELPRILEDLEIMRIALEIFSMEKKQVSFFCLERARHGSCFQRFLTALSLKRNLDIPCVSSRTIWDEEGRIFLIHWKMFLSTSLVEGTVF